MPARARREVMMVVTRKGLFDFDCTAGSVTVSWSAGLVVGVFESGSINSPLVIMVLLYHMFKMHNYPMQRIHTSYDYILYYSLYCFLDFSVIYLRYEVPGR